MRKLGLPAIKDEEHWTYAHYKTWPDDERWELIHGVAYNMCAAPNTRHQDYSGYMYLKIGNFLEGKPCKAFFAPVDVFFRDEGLEDDEIDSIVQPDLIVVCDRNKIRFTGCWGAPDIAVEILSPSTSRKDQREKFDLYRAHGVREYWIVDPTGTWITVYKNIGPGRFDNGTLYEYRKGEPDPVLVSDVLPGFSLDLAGMFGRE